MAPPAALSMAALALALCMAPLSAVLPFALDNRTVSIGNAETWRNGSWSLTVGSSHVDECLMLKQNVSYDFKLVPGLNGTANTVSFQSVAVPGSFLAQTGYEAWVQLFTMDVLKQRGLQTAEFIAHDSLFLAGYVAFEASEPQQRGKFITTRDDQGSDQGGFPCRIEGCNAEGSALQWAQQASFCLTDVNDDSSAGCPVPSGNPVTDCGKPLPKFSCSTTDGKCSVSPGGSFNSSASCQAGCKTPPPPPPPAPPPPPLSQNPCIRFGHTIPVANHVDVEIVQEEDSSITHTWTDFKFSDFSDWVNVFKPGKGTILGSSNPGGDTQDRSSFPQSMSS